MTIKKACGDAQSFCKVEMPSSKNFIPLLDKIKVIVEKFTCKLTAIFINCSVQRPVSVQLLQERFVKNITLAYSL